MSPSTLTLISLTNDTSGRLIPTDVYFGGAGRDKLFEREVEFAAAPDVFPPDKFNAGVMVVVPSPIVLEDMLSKVEDLLSYDGGDTGEKTCSCTKPIVMKAHFVIVFPGTRKYVDGWRWL